MTETVDDAADGRTCPDDQGDTIGDFRHRLLIGSGSTRSHLPVSGMRGTAQGIEIKSMRAYIGVDTRMSRKGITMARRVHSGPEDCNCLAVRQAARHITQFYDHFLALSGLRTTQFSILAKLRRVGPSTDQDPSTGSVIERNTRCPGNPSP